MALIKDWSSTAANNNSAAPDGAPEGMLPSDVNNVIRENMASIRTWYEDSEWVNYGHSGTQASATTFTIATDVTSTYTADRAIQIVDASTLYGFVVSSSYSAPNTTVTVELLTGSLTSSMNGETISLGSTKPSNDALPKNYKYGLHVYAADAGSTDAYAITLSPTPIALETGMVIHFKANTANTGAATLNVNSIGAVTIKRDGSDDLVNGNIAANQIVSVVYDGTNFQMISPFVNASGISSIQEDTNATLGSDLDTNGFAFDTTTSHDIQTNSTSRMDISDAGVRMGAANARVTTVLDEDAMGSDSATALATQQSIKAYVDAAIASAGAQTLIETQTPSGASNVTFTDLSSTYIKYIVEITDCKLGTDARHFHMRTSANNGSSYDSGASDYYTYMQFGVTGSIGLASVIRLTGASGSDKPGNATNEWINITVEIINPAGTNYTNAKWAGSYVDSGAQFFNVAGAGERRSAAAVDAIEFLGESSATITGTFKLYGIKAS